MSRAIVINGLGFVANMFVVGSMLLIRAKHHAGWILGLLSVFVWGLFDVYVGAWTAAAWCVPLCVLEVHGWRHWKREETAGAS